MSKVTKKVGYLGPEGTFSWEAVLRFLETETGIPVPFPSFFEIFDAVSRGELDVGVVPLENSCEGPVNLTLDLLAGDFQVKIKGEIILPVCNNLLVKGGTPGDELVGIISHPQPLAQCRDYLRKRYPSVPLTESSSTADAARGSTPGYPLPALRAPERPCSPRPWPAPTACFPTR